MTYRVPREAELQAAQRLQEKLNRGETPQEQGLADILTNPTQDAVDILTLQAAESQRMHDSIRAAWDACQAPIIQLGWATDPQELVNRWFNGTWTPDGPNDNGPPYHHRRFYAGRVEADGVMLLRFQPTSGSVEYSYGRVIRMVK